MPILSRMGTVTVAIIASDVISRRGIESIVRGEPDLSIAGAAATASEWGRLRQTVSPDVIVAVGAVLSARDDEAFSPRSAPPALALTGERGPDVLARLVAAGYAGVLGESSSAAEIALALRLLAAGSAVVSPDALRELIRPSSPRVLSDVFHARPALTERERDSVRELLTGATNAEIARSLHVSLSTVRAHLSSVMRKWEVRDRLQLALAAMSALVDPAHEAGALDPRGRDRRREATERG